MQRQREWPVRIVQALQSFGQRRVVATALNPGKTFRIPELLPILSRAPILRDLPGRLLAYGVWPVHLQH